MPGRPSKTERAVWALPIAVVIGLFVALLVAVTGWPVVGGAIAIATVGIALWLVAWVIDRQRRANQRTLAQVRSATSSLAAVDRRVDVTDSALSDSLRRTWEPTPLPWVHLGGSRDTVLLLPAAAFHLPEMIEISEALQREGVPTVMATGDRHWERLSTGLVWERVRTTRLPSRRELEQDIAAVVTMSDWGGYRPVVELAKQAGIPTIGKVEGAQDFFDVDTTQAKEPYTHVDYVLCQGVNDFRALAGRNRYVVGSTRLERLWAAPTLMPNPTLAIINQNFTYGVMPKARTEWLAGAVEAAESAGLQPLVSVHPAERATTMAVPTTSIPIARLLPRAAVLISRFSTVPFEAFARGVDFVYHNPHGEQVETFSRPEGAFEVSTTTDELADALGEISLDRAANRARTEGFFRRQVDIDVERPSGYRAAPIIAAAIDGSLLADDATMGGTP